MKAFTCMFCLKTQWLEKMYFYRGIHIKINLNGDQAIIMCCDNTKCIDNLKLKTINLIQKTITKEELLKFIKKQSQKHDMIPIEKTLKFFVKKGFSKASILSVIKKLIYSGSLYQPKHGFLKPT